MPSSVEANHAPNAICQILDDLDADNPKAPPTILYNEGWLLRLVLTAAERAIPGFPIQVAPGGSWFSEALLYSAFLARRRGDALAESCTHADGVVGHFQFNPSSKAGLMLKPNGTQFLVCEAKMFSKLSKGTKRAPNYDQAARNVACMAETLRRSGKPVSSWESLGFYVLAPESQISAGIFASEICHASINEKVAARIAAYDSETREQLLTWRDSWFQPLMESIDIRCLSWEQMISGIKTHDASLGRCLRAFYDLCLKHNRTAVPIVLVS